MAMVSNKLLVDNYFELIKNWDIEIKKSLILKLNQSIKAESTNSSDVSKCFGAWVDNRSADEIIDELKADRVQSRIIEDF